MLMYLKWLYVCIINAVNLFAKRRNLKVLEHIILGKMYLKYNLDMRLFEEMWC